MKKLLFAMLAALLLTACGRGHEEQLSLEQALLEKMQADSDLKDYNIDPKAMADCVLAEITQALPVMPMDPQRGAFFQAYANFVSTTNPIKAIDDATPLFGSKAAARTAAMNITEYIMSCMGNIMEQSEPVKHKTADPAKTEPVKTDKPAT